VLTCASRVNSNACLACALYQLLRRCLYRSTSERYRQVATTNSQNRPTNTNQSITISVLGNYYYVSVIYILVIVMMVIFYLGLRPSVSDLRTFGSIFGWACTKQMV